MNQLPDALLKATESYGDAGRPFQSAKALDATAAEIARGGARDQAA